MGVEVKINGVDLVMRNLNRALQKIEGQTLEGAIKAAILIMNDSYKATPKVPVDTSNLSHSNYITTSKGSSPMKGEDADSAILAAVKSQMKRNVPQVAFGYTANYAAVVHEDMASKKKWNRPGSGPKFLESAIYKNKAQIIKIIKDTAKL